MRVDGPGQLSCGSSAVHKESLRCLLMSTYLFVVDIVVLLTVLATSMCVCVSLQNEVFM